MCVVCENSEKAWSADAPQVAYAKGAPTETATCAEANLSRVVRSLQPGHKSSPPRLIEMECAD